MFILVVTARKNLSPYPRAHEKYSRAYKGKNDHIDRLALMSQRITMKGSRGSRLEGVHHEDGPVHSSLDL